MSPGQAALHTDPGTGVWVVERGVAGVAVGEGEAAVSRGQTGAVERLRPGKEIILNPGDAASYGSADVHISRNAGDVPSVILIAGRLAWRVRIGRARTTSGSRVDDSVRSPKSEQERRVRRRRACASRSIARPQFPA